MSRSPEKRGWGKISVPPGGDLRQLAGSVEQAEHVVKVVLLPWGGVGFAERFGPHLDPVVQRDLGD